MSRPKRSVGSLVRTVAGLLAVMALMAIVAGVVGWLLARSGGVFLIGPLAQRVPADKHVAFLAVWAHSVFALGGTGPAEQFLSFFGKARQAGRTRTATLATPDMGMILERPPDVSRPARTCRDHAGA